MYIFSSKKLNKCLKAPHSDRHHMYVVFCQSHGSSVLQHTEKTFSATLVQSVVQSEERIPKMCFLFTAERRDWKTHITDQTLLSVMTV